MDLTAYNTTHFRLSLDVSAWATAYTLTTASWRLQARQSAESTLITLEINSATGGAAYASGVVVFSAPLATLRKISAGSYEWDFGFTPVGGEFVRCDGGSLTVVQGVTR